MINIPEHILQKNYKLLLDFLWNSKQPKVKRSTIPEGGLGMVDVHLASKISWDQKVI